MSLWNRFGLSRRAQPDGEPFPADPATGSRADVQDVKAPQVRPVYGSKNLPRPDLAGDAPYPGRPADGKRRSPLDDMILSGEERKLAGALFGDPPATEPEPAVRPSPRPAIVVARKKMDRSDLTLGALGIVLGLTCALFPWYIFFNQDQFGVREFTFEGARGTTPPGTSYRPQLAGGNFRTDEVPRMDLDFFPTATLPREDENVRVVPASEQPFPADLVTFHLIHVANGRAMIQDDDGLWIVQPGSRLPDASKVASIERRSGKWVLVTTRDKVVSLEQ